jgi:hypothetical protein
MLDGLEYVCQLVRRYVVVQRVYPGELRGPDNLE